MRGALLTGTLQIKTAQPVLGKPIWVGITMTNESDRTLEIINPDVGTPPPNLHWTASDEAYRIALLISIGALKIILKNGEGQLIESKGLQPWVTPIIGTQNLQPHQSLTFEFDVNELFSLESSGFYHLWLRYGNDVYAESMIDFKLAESAS
ncbi:MAG: hypothetical protein WD398_07190 [Cyclobacteriaceae bacterium]